MVLVIITPPIAIKVSRKYTNLRRQKIRSTGKAYPLTKLKQNIAQALSVNGDYVDPIELKEPIYNDWILKNYKVLHYGHWFYAVQVMTGAEGEIIAKVVDALYDGDYHNDKMETKPYDESIQKILSLIERIEKK